MAEALSEEKAKLEAALGAATTRVRSAEFSKQVAARTAGADPIARVALCEAVAAEAAAPELAADAQVRLFAVVAGLLLGDVACAARVTGASLWRVQPVRFALLHSVAVRFGDSRYRQACKFAPSALLCRPPCCSCCGAALALDDVLHASYKAPYAIGPSHGSAGRPVCPAAPAGAQHQLCLMHCTIHSRCNT